MTIPEAPKPRVLKPFLADAFREWIKIPGNAEEFARFGNALAAELRRVNPGPGPDDDTPPKTP